MLAPRTLASDIEKKSNGIVILFIKKSVVLHTEVFLCHSMTKMSIRS